MSIKITFSELVKAFAESHDLTQQKAEDLIRGVFDLVIDDLEENGKASITNFGSFELKEVAERTGINPQTKEEIIIPAHNKVSFKPFKALESTVNAPFANLEPRLLGETSDAAEEPESETKASGAIAAESQDIEPEDPFEAVIEEEKKSEENEETATLPPPVYKAPDKNEENEVSWLFIVLVLVIAAAGVWFFFLRDSDSGDLNQMTAQNQAAAQEQAEQVEEPSSNQEQMQEEVSGTDNMEDNTNSTSENNEASSESASSTTKSTPKTMTTYIIEKDEWMWDISREVYGEPYLWPLIFEANKTVNDNPNLVEPANTLMIPALDGDSSNLTKGDYAKLASATKLVSEAYAKAGNSERAAEYSRFAAKYERNSKN